MIQRYIVLFKKMWYVITHPIDAWGVIKNEPDAPVWYFKNLILPIIVAITLVTFGGYFLFALAIQEYSVLYAFVKALAVCCESFFTFYVTFIVIKELREKLKADIGSKNLFKIMVYSFAPFWIAVFISGFLANYATLSSFLRFLGLYGVILFLSALDQWQLVAPNRRTLFAFVTAAIAVIIYQLIGWSFSFALKAIQFSNLLTS